MKTLKQLLFFTAFMALATLSGYSQDFIYLTDKSIQKGKVLQVNEDIIKYKKFEIPNGPTYELSKSKVTKIRYANGYIDRFVASTIDSLMNDGASPHADSVHYSEIFFLFNDAQDEDAYFPIYLNGKYLFTIKNHMRITYKIFSTGSLIIERKHKNKIGPATDITIVSGKKYGVRILEPYHQAVDPNKKYKIEIIGIKNQVDQFLENEFFKLQPFAKDDINLTEDINDPVIE